MLFRSLLIAIVMLSAGCSSLSPSPLLTSDPNWTSVTLSNGFRYHLYPLEGQDVEVRLVVNVGSLNEADGERGYAHFIEHMAFNGTQRFPNNSVFDEFASVGVEFGPDINAVTEYGRTIYQLSLPDDESANQALAWFRDIGDGLLLDDDEVDGEIGVIFGEWRQDNRSATAWQLQLYDALLQGTPYIQRDPIGTEETLLNATSQSLRGFYHQWYQANHMQLVVIGGFDEASLSKEIEKEFSSLRTTNTEPAQHQLPELDPNIQYPSTLYAPKGESPAVVLSFPAGRHTVPLTLRDQQDTWLDWMVLDAIQLRLEEQFDRQGISHNGIYNSTAFTPGYDVYEVVLEFNDVDRRRVLEALADNVSSLRDHGVSDDEFNALVEQYKSSIGLFDDVLSVEIAETAMQYLYTNRLSPDDEQERSNFVDFLSSLSLAAFNDSLETLLAEKHQAITLVYANGESIADADSQRAAYFANVSKRGNKGDIAYLDVNIPQPEYFSEASISATTQHLGLYEWQLPNGLPVMFYQMDQPTYETYVVVQAKGGLSALSRRERAALDLLFETYRAGLVGNINAYDFSHHLEARGIFIEPEVFGKSHNLSLLTPNESLPDALNALRYMVEESTPNNETFEREKARVVHLVNSAEDSPYDQFGRASYDALNPADSYDSPLSSADYEAVSFDDVVKLYQKLYGDLGGFKIYLVSDEPVETMQGLASAYLGGVATDRRETPTRQNSYRDTPTRVVMHVSPEDRTYVERIIVDESEARTLDLIFAEDMLNRVLRQRYNNLVREKYGLTYDPYFSSWTGDGELKSVTTLTALISPEKETELEALWPEIQQKLSESVTVLERNNAARQLSRDMYDIGNDGLYMIGMLARYDLWDYGIEGVLYPDDVIERVDEQWLSRLAGQLFKNGILFESILRPQNTAE